MAELRKVADVAIYEQLFASEAELVAAVKDCEIIIANRERTKFTRQLLDQLPNLRLISNTGTHVYHIDEQAATERGILLTNAPGGSSPSVAELTISFVVALARDMIGRDQAMKRGEWPATLVGSIQGSTLGILGLGQIGTRVARAARALETRVVAWGPTLTDERAARWDVERLELDDVFRQSDFVSVHLTLSDTSRHLVDARRLGLMKSTAFLINTARAAITDEDAVVEALRSHQIAGAALDVFMEEPLPADSPLRSLDNVILSPHAGWTTREAFGPWIEMTVENALSYLNGDPIRVHNPEALQRANP
jgi:D-3-phosphoglycerate dehydrogenase / 2-oxoglutarate reductase